VLRTECYVLSAKDDARLPRTSDFELRVQDAK
jgi:hypothetical protein